RLVRPAPSPDDDRSAGRRRVRRVEQQVDECLLQDVRAAHDLGDVKAVVDLRTHAAKRALCPAQLVGTANDPRGLHGHEPILVRPGVVEQAADNAVESLELPGYPFGDLWIRTAAP